MDRWQDKAACRGVDPDLFFTERGESQHEALQVCATCPVAAECLEAGWREEFGIWGGQPINGRRRLRVRSA